MIRRNHYLHEMDAINAKAERDYGMQAAISACFVVIGVCLLSLAFWPMLAEWIVDIMTPFRTGLLVGSLTTLAVCFLGSAWALCAIVDAAHREGR